MNPLFVDNGGVRISYYDSNPDGGSESAVAFVPGFLGTAEMYLSDFNSMGHRRCISYSPRGFGQSDAPTEGYSFSHILSDLDVVLANASPKSVCLFAHSMGVPLAIRFAEQNRNKMRGLVLIDYPAKYSAISHTQAEKAKKRRKTLGDDPVIDAYLRESVDVDLWDSLPQVACPVLLITGVGEGTLLSETDLQRYSSLLRSIEVWKVSGPGHEPWNVVGYGPFMDRVRAFWDSLDEAG